MVQKPSHANRKIDKCNMCVVSLICAFARAQDEENRDKVLRMQCSSSTYAFSLIIIGWRVLCMHRSKVRFMLCITITEKNHKFDILHNFPVCAPLFTSSMRTIPYSSLLFFSLLLQIFYITQRKVFFSAWVWHIIVLHFKRKTSHKI